jgi:hypothetical protein
MITSLGRQQEQIGRLTGNRDGGGLALVSRRPMLPLVRAGNITVSADKRRNAHFIEVSAAVRSLQ